MGENDSFVFSPAITRRHIAVLAGTVAFALGAEVVAQDGAQDEVLLRRQPVQRAGNDAPYGLQALPAAEEQVDLLPPGPLDEVVYTLVPQPDHGILLIAAVHGVQHHFPYAFLQFIDVV